MVGYKTIFGTVLELATQPAPVQTLVLRLLDIQLELAPPPPTEEARSGPSPVREYLRRARECLREAYPRTGVFRAVIMGPAGQVLRDGAYRFWIEATVGSLRGTGESKAALRSALVSHLRHSPVRPLFDKLLEGEFSQSELAGIADLDASQVSGLRGYLMPDGRALEELLRGHGLWAENGLASDDPTVYLEALRTAPARVGLQALGKAFERLDLSVAQPFNEWVRTEDDRGRPLSELPARLLAAPGDLTARELHLLGLERVLGVVLAAERSAAGPVPRLQVRPIIASSEALGEYLALLRGGTGEEVALPTVVVGPEDEACLASYFDVVQSPAAGVETHPLGAAETVHLEERWRRVLGAYSRLCDRERSRGARRLSVRLAALNLGVILGIGDESVQLRVGGGLVEQLERSSHREDVVVAVSATLRFALGLRERTQERLQEETERSGAAHWQRRRRRVSSGRSAAEAWA